VTLTATPNVAAGYKFDKWVGTDGSTSVDNPYTPPKVEDDVTYIAQFVKDKYKINVAEDPTGTGKAYVFDPENPSEKDSNKLTTLEVPVGGKAKISVGKEYRDEFLYWTTSVGTKLYEPEITIEDVRADETFTAHFASEIEITIGHSPDGAAEVRMDKNGWVSGDSYKIKTGDDIILEARSKDESKYRFVKWQTGNGLSYTENPVKIVNVTSTDTFVAIYESTKCKVTANANPADGGTAWVKGNSNDYKQGSDEADIGKTVTLKAVPNEGHTFLYWDDSSGTRYAGTAGSAGENILTVDSIGGDTTFTAHFGKGKVNITIDVAPREYGTAEFNNEGYVATATTYQLDGGSYMMLTALSNDKNKYKFNRWEDSKGNFYNDNPLTVIDVTADEKFTAVFTTTDE
jgi:uncharacterized repeat protein (TIGR02543 family)